MCRNGASGILSCAGVPARETVVLDSRPPTVSAKPVHISGRIGGRVSMHSIYRTLRTAIHALRRNIMRSVLTCLGIIIGISAVIAMMEIGQGSSVAIQRASPSLGANILLVLPGQAANGGISSVAGSVMTLTPEDCEAILKECPAVRDAAPEVTPDCHSSTGNKTGPEQH